MKSNLAERIRALRRAGEFTQGDIAKVCGVTRPAVSQWESLDDAARTRPNLDQLKAIVKLARVPLEWLINDDVDPESAWDVIKQNRYSAKQQMPNKYLEELRENFIKGVMYEIATRSPGHYVGFGANGIDFMHGNTAVQFFLATDQIDKAVAKLLSLPAGVDRVLLCVGDAPEAAKTLKDLFNIQIQPARDIASAADFLLLT